ncbi:hypothetical protein E2562_019231 [Oryza meyeriana var. granulata]|uniref:Flavin-containing monooxygenase n=1 Tax=Oryza meyeriana var. granulata TaxID=110450 RepID=A0A6G1FAA8_9ORYZ|nr:hypothetical protein E2562_019231 [Oryza meyeriana var. granulata]
MTYPAGTPAYVRRERFVEYLNTYTNWFEIQPRYHTTVKLVTYDGGNKYWVVLAWDTDTGVMARLASQFLIVATRENNTASIPLVPGLTRFEGEVIHLLAYKSRRGYTGKSVFVIGSGNCNIEIAYDLATHRADTSIVVCSPNGENMFRKDVITPTAAARSAGARGGRARVSGGGPELGEAVPGSATPRGGGGKAVQSKGRQWRGGWGR